MSADFLVEIGTEELPPKALLALSEAFKAHILKTLTSAQLSFGETRLFASPRRIALVVKALAEQTPAKAGVAWGPPAKVAFDSEDLPTRAALAFARKNGLAVETLKSKIEHDGKQDKLCHRTTHEGSDTSTLLGDIVNEALAALPIPKRMRWGAKRDEFVRPVHWVVMLFGNTIIDSPVLSTTPGRDSRGHRFHSNGPIVIQSPASYAEDLRAAYVIADFSERREIIRNGVTQAAAQAGGKAVIDDDLLDEVTALNEWPVPLLGSFEQRFLAVPPEALISSMKEHQKYFHVIDSNNQLMPLFVTVANIESSDPAQVIAGNEKVIRPRLADAAFFYETDKKHDLSSRREQLKSVVFQEKLGTLFDKTQRIATLGEHLAPFVGADPTDVKRAGELCKSDLVSEMVLEFDDLQGIMGRYYALNDGEKSDVAEAMLEHYLPAFAGDHLPSTATGTAIALADRIDTVVGIFGVGQPPSGSRDPFALRRASLGILRIIVEKSIDIDLRTSLDIAQGLHAGLTVEGSLSKQVLTYIFDRFKSWYEDESFAAEVFMAVNAKNLDNPLDFHQRAHAVHNFSKLPEALALAAANKRVSNILSKTTQPLPGHIDPGLFEGNEEHLLFDTLNSIAEATQPLFEDRDYNGAMQQMAKLKEPVDTFFDKVMVMADDPAIQANRLQLLTELRNLFLNIADISLLVPAK